MVSGSREWMRHKTWEETRSDFVFASIGHALRFALRRATRGKLLFIITICGCCKITTPVTEVIDIPTATPLEKSASNNDAPRLYFFVTAQNDYFGPFEKPIMKKNVIYNPPKSTAAYFDNITHPKKTTAYPDQIIFLTEGQSLHVYSHGHGGVPYTIERDAQTCPPLYRNVAIDIYADGKASFGAVVRDLWQNYDGSHCSFTFHFKNKKIFRLRKVSLPILHRAEDINSNAGYMRIYRHDAEHIVELATGKDRENIKFSPSFDVAVVTEKSSTFEDALRKATLLKEKHSIGCDYIAWVDIEFPPALKLQEALRKIYSSLSTFDTYNRKSVGLLWCPKAYFMSAFPFPTFKVIGKNQNCIWMRIHVGRSSPPSTDVKTENDTGAEQYMKDADAETGKDK